MASAVIALSPVQEGPHSVLNEEEFFDALEIAYHEDEKEKVSDILRAVAIMHARVRCSFYYCYCNQLE